MPGVSLPKIVEGYANAQRLYGFSNLNANRLAILSVNLRDKSSAHQAFASIANMEPDVLGGPRTFAAARAWANSTSSDPIPRRICPQPNAGVSHFSRLCFMRTVGSLTFSPHTRPGFTSNTPEQSPNLPAEVQLYHHKHQQNTASNSLSMRRCCFCTESIPWYSCARALRVLTLPRRQKMYGEFDLDRRLVARHSSLTTRDCLSNRYCSVLRPIRNGSNSMKTNGASPF